MGHQAGQNGGDKYCKCLIWHPFYRYNTMQIRQQRAEQTETNHVRSHRHRRADKIGGKTYCERADNRLRSAIMNSIKH